MLEVAMSDGLLILLFKPFSSQGRVFVSTWAGKHVPITTFKRRTTLPQSFLPLSFSLLSSLSSLFFLSALLS